jgi:hypothetical protein
MTAMNTTTRRSTVYLKSDLHRALRLKAMETDQSVSDLINDAIQISLMEDADDLAKVRQRQKESNLDFEQVLKDLKRRGKI